MYINYYSDEEQLTTFVWLSWQRRVRTLSDPPILRNAWVYPKTYFLVKRKYRKEKFCFDFDILPDMKIWSESLIFALSFHFLLLIRYFPQAMFNDVK